MYAGPHPQLMEQLWLMEKMRERKSERGRRGSLCADWPVVREVMSIDLQSRREGFWPEVLQNESIWGSGLASIPTRSFFIIWLSATYSCCLLLLALCTLHYKGQRPINALQEVDTDLISQWMIISGLTRHWFAQGPKVAVVVASVFNTLNTIDCRVGGIFWRMLELDWTVRNLRSSQERKRRCLPSRRMQLGLSTRPSSTFVSQVLPLQPLCN